MTAHTQPSPEAVGLVAAALRAERALTVYEEDLTRYTLPRHSPVHAAYIRANDFATERLFAYVTTMEQKAALYDLIDHQEWAVEMTAEEGKAWRIRTGFRDGNAVLVYGNTLEEVVTAALERAA